MKLFHRSGVCALALMAGTAAMQFEPAVLRDVAVGHGDRQVSIGAVKTSLWSVAFAQNADSFTLENVRFSWGVFTYEAKQVAFTGASVTRGEIENLFSSDPAPLANRLARINAKQVTIPELKVTQTLGKDIQTTLYRNVSLNDVIAGRIATLIIETTAVEETGEKGPTLMSYGKTTLADLDTPAAVRLYETKDASAPLTKIYGSFSIEQIDANVHAGTGGVQIARLSGRDIMARPTKDSWSGALILIKELAEKENTSPEEETHLLHSAADLLGAFDAGLIEATGITTKGGGKDNKGAGSIARIAYTGASGSQPAEARVEGMEFADADARVKIGAVSLTGFSFVPTLNGLKALDGKKLEELDHATMRSLIPTLGTLRITDLDVDSPHSKNKPAERVKFTIGSMEITADKPVNGLPTNIRIEQRNASMSLPPDSTDDFIQGLRALGYETFGSSFLVAAHWNEATGEISLNEVSTQGQDMGSIALSGLIGNVGKELFSADEASAAAALLGMKAKTAHLVIEDKGLLGRYLAQAAKGANTTPEALRKSYANAAPMVISSMLGDTEQTKALGQAVARFIAQPGRLTIDAEPKNPAGFGVMDAMLASNPKAALEKLKITAKAE